MCCWVVVIVVVVVCCCVCGVVVGLDHPSVGHPSVGHPSAGPPKIPLFFHSPAPFLLCLSCFRRPGPSNVHVWLRGRRGFTRQPENSKREHLTVPALPAGHGKKREILGSHPSGPTLWGTIFRVWAQPFGVMTHTGLAKKGLAKVGLFQQHTSPFHFALSIESGCECVAHIAQAMTDLDPTTTLLSVDGIGAFDLISRNNVAGTHGGRWERFGPTFCATIPQQPVNVWA